MGKILLTALGGVTQNYRATNYSIEGKEYSDKKFILSALDEHYNFDKIFVLGTTSSMWDAFYEHICDVTETPSSVEDYMFINNQCSLANHETNFSDIDLTPITNIIPEKYNLKFMKFGISEFEMIENLKLLMEITENLDKEHEIYLDLTHGFRSNAFYMFMVMNYINDVKDSNDAIKGIFYGMHESKLNPTPILNLKIFSEISNLLKGVHDIKNYGNFYTITNSIEDIKIKNKLDNFSNSLNINYIGEVKNRLNELNNIIKALRETDNPLINMIVPKALNEFLDKFSNIKNNQTFLLEISKWYYEQKKYATSYLTMREAITAFFCDKYLGSSTKENIEEANSKINRLHNSYRNTSKIEKLDPSYKQMEKLLQIFRKCREIRNNIAHSGDQKLNAISDINNIPKYIDELNILFKDKNFANYLKNRLTFFND